MEKYNIDERFSLKNKKIIITGAFGILGKYFVNGLIEAGASVALIDVCEDVIAYGEDLQSRNLEQKIIGYKCDIVNENSVEKSIQQIVEDFGQINVLHNNAASKGSSLEEFLRDYENYSYDTWKEIMNVNVDGMFLMSKHVGKQFIKQGSGGSIIQTASIYGVVSPDQRIYEGSFYNGLKISSPGVYSASKAAVVGLTKYLAGYWGHEGIRVNTLTPGGVESGQNEDFLQNYSNRVPLGRMAKADDMIGALVFLASDASSYVTGQNIIIDGGLTVW